MNFRRISKKERQEHRQWLISEWKKGLNLGTPLPETKAELRLMKQYLPKLDREAKP